MKDIHQILRDKEADCARVQLEIEALRLVISLLEEGEDRVPEGEIRKQPEPAVESAAAPSGTGTEGPNFSALQGETSFWKRRR